VKQATGVGFGVGVELVEVVDVEEGVGEGVTSGAEEIVEEPCKTELEDTTTKEADSEVLEGVALDKVWALETYVVLSCGVKELEATVTVTDGTAGD
jgi:hypothetical protein